jgi:hypothetical protein
MFARPFAYNSGSTISGTIQVGNLAIGVEPLDYSQNPGGVQWWNGPDETIGYVIAHPVPTFTQPNPLGIPAGVGFWRSQSLTEESFLFLANNIPPTKGVIEFSAASDASTWLTTNGYWNSYVNTYQYNPSTFLSWPSSSAGYTLYSGGFTSVDDGYSNSPITLPTTFETNNQASTNLYLSTNGYFTLGSGSGGIFSTPQQQSNPALMCANPGDNWLQPGLSNSDGDVQNWYYMTGSDGGNKYYVKNLVYAGTYGAQTTPTSYIINFYIDGVYQWLETRAKSNTRGNAGPYNNIDVSQASSTTSKVWRGDLNGQNWVYMGTGSVTP